MLKMLLSAVLAVFLMTGQSLAEACNGDAVTYTITYKGDQRFDVVAKLGIPSTRVDLYHFPSDENPKGQSRFVEDLQAFDASGGKQQMSETDDGGWTMTQPATRLSYTVNARHDDVRWGPGKDEVATYFDETFFFVGNSILMADYEWPACPARISFDLPKDWHVSAPWAKNGNTFVVDSWSALTFNAFSLGKLRSSTIQVDNLEVSWLTSKSLSEIEPEVARLTSTIARAYTDYFGGAPVDNYSAFLFTDDMSDGGAFQASIGMRIGVPLTETEAIAWRHTFGHEMAHLWTALGSNTDASAIAETYWYREGFTDYIALRVMAREGLIDHAVYEARLANIVRRYRAGQRFRTTPSLVKAGADKSPNWEYLYGGGSMIAWLLDEELAKRGKTGLEPLIKKIYAERHTIHSHAELMALMNAHTDGLAGEIFTWVEQKHSIPELRQRFSDLDIEVSVFHVDEAYVKASTLSGEIK